MSILTYLVMSLLILGLSTTVLAKENQGSSGCQTQPLKDFTQGNKHTLCNGAGNAVKIKLLTNWSYSGSYIICKSPPGNKGKITITSTDPTVVINGKPSTAGGVFEFDVSQCAKYMAVDGLPVQTGPGIPKGKPHATITNNSEQSICLGNLCKH